MTHYLIAKQSYCLVPFGFKAQCVSLPHFPIAWLHLIPSLSRCSITRLSHCPTVSLSYRLLSHSFTVSLPCYPITLLYCLNASLISVLLLFHGPLLKKSRGKVEKQNVCCLKKNSSEMAISAQLFTAD
jgi:hypothetical protein